MKNKPLLAGMLIALVLTGATALQIIARDGIRILDIHRESPEFAPLTVVPAADTDTTGLAVGAARAFISTLAEDDKKKALYDWSSDQKTRWSNLPTPLYQRRGLRVGDMKPAQRDATMKLLSVVLSKEGYKKVREIMEGDEVLRTSGIGPDGGPMGQGGGNRPPQVPPGGGPGRLPGGLVFSRDEYFIAVIGTPSLTDPWMVQFGGHHLAINLTIAGKSAIMTPSLPAAQPAVYKMNGETVRPLGKENDKSFALINALNPSQQKKAILNYEIAEVVLGPGQDGKTIPPEGIKCSELTDKQKEMVLDLAHEWVGFLNEDAARVKMAELRKNIDATWFAWSGPIVNGKGAYFRVQGPTVFIEYSPQRFRGGGLDPNHLHTIYRDPTNDYGVKFVKK